ncbi:uncharacterized protein BP01DRAFT_374453 [Aspergillus saccharolyticus JOP 1030-1]|uniref:DUF6604 domain-containing protein n=1 Tax=Aspergillus saccharolyticus JOP 1030-1 TaxID=1450539 RepID=A0A318ZBJ9_9EURO|nr:hypothetical protein BP01DRAFT_374453 [Aspergillus saccharolyticus JOP 1030-1]PYH44756.1 hypothetical protein BP01DRAFT_374453 [Aspergillus saccharolyticus JOP 1030-1]
MLPKFLQSSYARYKADTNTSVTWLLETANRCGYHPPTLSATPPTTKSKEKFNSKSDDSDLEPLQSTATTKDLQKFAEIVAGSALPVPKSILTLAKRAIKLRKEVTSWFLGKGDSANNESHAHFITALEEICDILEWKTHWPSKPDAKQPPPTSPSQTDDIKTDWNTNKFAVLTVEEPQETAQTQLKSEELKKIVQVTVNEEDDEKAADADLDLHDMRNFISFTLSEYRDKKVDLMSAEIVTDSALQLARDLVEEVEADWRTSLSGQGDDVQNLVFNLSVLSRGGSAVPSLDIGLPYNKNMADIADWCYVPTKVLLESFANVLQAEHVPVFKKGHFGTYDSKADRGRMSPGQKFEEDKLIMFSLLPEFCMVHTFDLHMPAQDTITGGLTEFTKTKKVTLWLCYAVQVFLDVHHMMRYSVLGAFEDLRMSGLRIQKTIDDYLQLSKTHHPPGFWPKEGHKTIQNISSDVQSWIIQDFHHAILCGLFLFNLNWYDVQLLAFLHNLVINCPPHKDLRWPDMDAFIKIHGESHIFVGSRPKNASTSSAPHFARNSGENYPFHKPDGKNARLLKPTTTVAELFFAQYVQLVLDKLSQFESDGTDLQRCNPKLILTRQWSSTHRIGTLQLLAFLRIKLYEEEPVILYNYFGMHRRSIELLRLIRHKEHQKFSCIPYIVVLIHHVARGSAQILREMGLCPPGAKTWSRIVVSAGDVMREYLKKNGEVACKELRTSESPGPKYYGFGLEDMLGPKGMASLMTGIPVAD